MSSITHLQNGRYAVLKKLGEGGKGIVYKARDTVLDRVVAIKILKTTVAGEESYTRFMREAQTVGKLNHPNIVSIHNVGKEDDRHFLVLEFVDGMSLRELLDTYPEGKCDIQTVLRIGIEVCGALHYAHSQGILHRDIKPENVMLTQEDKAKLMDFGLAKMLGQPGLTQEGIIVGTVAYVAPEIALGRGADARSDLYSFGAVLYEAVTGKSPFVGEDALKVIFSHIHDHPVPPSRLNAKVPQALSDCIMKLLEKEPEKRFQSAEDLLKTLREISEEFLKETLVPSHKPSIAPQSPRPVGTIETQLVDRVEEMSLLREAVDKAVRGEGGLFFLHGEPGIGKTRLTKELRAYAHLRGMQVLYGRCPAMFRTGGVPPYVLWSEIIRDYLENCNLEQLHRVIGFYPAEVARLVPEISQKLRTAPQFFPISPEHEQNRLFEAVSQFIANISLETPLLVILDDLQWTDSTSLLLLHYLARGVDKESLLLLGVYRSTDIDSKHPLTPVLTELNRERLPQSVSLKRMSLSETSEMIKQLLRQDDIPEEFCSLVYERTRGNPFFAEEVLQSLKEEEIIYREKDKWAIKEVTKIEFPETVKSVVKARIDRLDDECQSVLTMASFIGNDVSWGALCGVTGIEENKMIEIIDKILKTGLLKHRVIRGEDTCSFVDIIVRDVVYEEVSAFRRKKQHNDVGRALEKAYAKKIDEHFGELASHFLEGGDREKALDYFLKAGDRAAKMYANNEAVSYFHSALNLLDGREDKLREKGHVLESLGDINQIVAEYKESKKFFNEALLLWQQLNENRKVADVHRKLATQFWSKDGDVGKAKEHYDEALKILGTQPESIELANLYLSMANMYFQTGSMAEALSWSEEAQQLAQKLDEKWALARSYYLLGAVFMGKGQAEKACECAEKSLKISLDHNYAENAILAYINLYAVLPVEESEKRLDCLERAFDLARKAGIIASISRVGSILSWTYSLMGDTEKALSLAEESAALDRRADDSFCLSWSMVALGFAQHLLGEWGASEQSYKEALASAEKAHSYQTAAYGNGVLGILYFDKGEYDKARECFDKMHEVLEKAGATLPHILHINFIVNAETYVQLGELDKARTLIDEMQESAAQTKDKSLTANADLSRAIQFRAERKWTESLRFFEKGLQELETLEARKWSLWLFARALSEYAQLYLERNEEGDREKAHNLLNQALEIFQKMGAKKDIEKILAKKKLLTS